MIIKKSLTGRMTVTKERKEEIRAMEAYKKSVTKSPETANAFLKRIGAYDIKK